MKGVLISTEDTSGLARRSRSLPTWQAALPGGVRVLPAVRGAELEAADARVSPLAVLRMGDPKVRNGLATLFAKLLHDGDAVSHINQVGCALSHAAAWRLVAESGEAHVVVEDDTSCLAAPEEVARAVADAGADAVFVSLYAGCKPTATDVWACAREFWGFQAYWIAPEGARRLLDGPMLPVSMHCDRYLAARVLQTGDRRFRIAQPQLRVHEEGGSLLGHPEDGRVWMIVTGAIGGVVLLLVAFWVGNRAKCARCAE